MLIPKSVFERILGKIREAGFPIKDSKNSLELAISWISRIEHDQMIEGFNDGNLTRFRSFENLDIRWHLTMIREYGYILKGTETVDMVIEIHKGLRGNLRKDSF